MSKEVIFDFESLSTDPKATLLSMGIIVMDPSDFVNMAPQDIFNKCIKDGFYVKLKVSNQVEKYGRCISKSTLTWWERQMSESPKAAEVLLPHKDDVDISELPDMVRSYLAEAGYTDGHCWSRGMIDATWFNTLCDDMGIAHKDQPMKWFKQRDIRTFIDTLTGSNNGYLPKQSRFEPAGMIPHNAMHDCARDVVQMVIASVLNDLEQEDIPF